MARIRVSIAALFCWVVLLAFASAASAQARNINIPAEDLKTALDSYIQQSGVQLVYTVNDVDGLRSTAVAGRFEPIQALDKLLQGTQLAANRDASGAVIVSKRLSAAPDIEPAPASPGVENVTVTGSRVISDITNSPTPLTEISAEQLQSTTPTDIPDALNKLPVFFGSTSQRTTSTSSSNTVANVLDLRNFGANRTLILLDGHRAAATNFDNTVSTDVLPQMLVQRVDVVTGGASAVYGSDAVTGVVNFVLDKKFDGFKYNANAGISKYGDAATYQGGAAAGMDIFGGRGHIEGSLRFYHQDGVPITARPYGWGGQAWVTVGAGTAANPYVAEQFTRKPTEPQQGGVVTCVCSANNTTFISNGVLGPFDPGAPTGTPSLSIGGDGGQNYDQGAFQGSLRAAEAFGRISYDVNDSTTAYVQFSGSEANNFTAHAPASINPGPGRGNVFFANNAYLPAATQAQLEAGNNTNMFNFAEYIENVDGVPVSQTKDDFGDGSTDRYLSVTTGITGSFFGKYTWDLYYTHGENRQEEAISHNTNLQKLIASEDAVLNPAGQVVCEVSLTAFANLNPGCIPSNPFGPTSFTQSQFNYFEDRTSYVATNIMDDVGGSVVGEFSGLPAGAIKIALSAEARWLSLDVESAFNPGNLVNCTGLRLCTTSVTLYDQPTVAPADVSNNVFEFAGEVNVPVLKDVPLVQQFNIDLAGRYTDYSTSGVAETWKIGLDYHVNDSIRFRGTASVDIRAPTLFDLYQPLTVATSGFNDQLTGVNLSIPVKAQGNPALTPEVAHTYTGGIVMTPDFLPGFTASVDYYRIDMSSAITVLSGANPDLQSICIKSGGTSPYCSLVSRPFAYTNTTRANFPTFFLDESINSAKERTEGTDVELDYNFDMTDLVSGVPGSVTLRSLTSYQPYITTGNYPGAPPALTPMPKVRSSSFVSYKFGDWGIDLQDTWLSGFSQKTLATLVFAQPHLRSFNTLDVSVNKQLITDSNAVDLYFSVQNIFNAQPPIDPPINSGAPGEVYPALTSESAMGRYFILGIRGEL